MYLGHPHHFPYTQDVLPSPSTHRIGEDDLNCQLQRSEDRKDEDRLTEPYSHVEAKASASGASDMLHTQSTCWGSTPQRRRSSKTARGRAQCSRDSRSLSRGATFHIRKALERCTFGTHRTASTLQLFIHFHWNIKVDILLFSTYIPLILPILLEGEC